MFEHLAEFDKILVTGPQRSGTRIAAKMIAHDLEYRYVDEVEIHVDSLYALRSSVEQESKIVVQCPALCRDIHYFGDRDDVAVVLMMRNLVAIQASQDRIGWTESWGPLELTRYHSCPGKPAVIAARKYAFWYSHQVGEIEHSFELAYDSLSTHPLWVPRERRASFGSAQTEEE